MLKLNERFVVDAAGEPVEVILSIAEYRALLNRLRELDATAPPLPPLEQWSAEFHQALAKAGFTTREQILKPLARLNANNCRPGWRDDAKAHLPGY